MVVQFVNARYISTGTFGVAALAAYASAAGDEQALQQAVDLFDLIVPYLTSTDLIPAKFTD